MQLQLPQVQLSQKILRLLPSGEAMRANLSMPRVPQPRGVGEDGAEVAQQVEKGGMIVFLSILW
jgi:hypothetical protein